MEARNPLLRLTAEGLVRHHRGALRTTARWQGAMARAAVDLCEAGTGWRDLRVPIALAFTFLYEDLADGDLAALVEAMLPIESAELGPVKSADVVSI